VILSIGPSASVRLYVHYDITLFHCAATAEHIVKVSVSPAKIPTASPLKET